MKNSLKIKALLWNFIVIFSMGIVTSCHDDDEFFTNEMGSSLEVNDKFKLSSFILQDKYWNLPDSIKVVNVLLQSLTDNSTIELDVDVLHEKEQRIFNIHIPSNQKIKDSDYLMRGYRNDGRSLGNVLKVTFKNEMLSEILDVQVEYTLLGEGTETSPYLIEDQYDFMDFADILSEDQASAEGLYFLQTEDIDIDEILDLNMDFLYYAYPFAGIYDGGNHRLSYSQQGEQNEIGLFSKLLNNAVVKNLYIVANLVHPNNMVGLIAGSAKSTESGKITIENVKLKGSISGLSTGSYVGGMIGLVEGNLTVEGCDFNGDIKGGKNVGFIVGELRNGKLTVSKTGNPASTLYLEGMGNVGFIAGCVNKGSIEINDFQVCYSLTPGAEIDVATSFHPNLGGLIGSASLEGPSSISKCTVEAALKGVAGVGGLLGNVELTKSATLTLKKCRVNESEITGLLDDAALGASLQYDGLRECVGGYFGKAVVSPGSNIILDGESGVITDHSVTSGNALSGDYYVGGLAGLYDGKITIRPKFTIAKSSVANIKGAGGIFGGLYNSTLDVTNKYFNIDNTLNIKAGESAGGLIGELKNSTVDGGIENLQFPNLVAASSFPTHFRSIVGMPQKGKSIGGLIGSCYNSNLHGLCFTGTVYGDSQVGGIVGYANMSSISYCVNNATKYECSNSSAGGIVGLFDWTPSEGSTADDIVFHDLLNYSNIGSESVIPNDAGGIVGKVYLTKRPFKTERIFMDWLVNRGNVNGSYHVGGCVGFFEDTTLRLAPGREGDADSAGNHFVRYAANYGEVTSTKEGCVGGIMGNAFTYTMLIQHSANHGKVEGNTSNGGGDCFLGGIVGSLGIASGTAEAKQRCNGEIKECCNLAQLSANGKNMYAGGILGRKEEGDNGAYGEWWQIKDCYNLGNLDGGEDDYNGGICGYCEWNNIFNRCLSIGYVNGGEGNGIVGETKGTATPTRDDCYIRKGSGKKDSHIDAPTMMDEGELKNRSEYSDAFWSHGWDISSDVNNGYAYLKNCPFQFVKP